MAVEARRLEAVDGVFGIQAASRALIEGLPSWMQELGLLVEAIELYFPKMALPLGIEFSHAFPDDRGKRSLIGLLERSAIGRVPFYEIAHFVQ